MKKSHLGCVKFNASDLDTYNEEVEGTVNLT